MIEITLIILGILFCLQLFININLWRKFVKLKKYTESVKVNHEEMIAKFYGIVLSAHREMARIDKRGLFKSTDEVGFIFNNLKGLLDSLEQKITDLINLNGEEKI